MEWIDVKEHLPENCSVYEGRRAINLLVLMKSRYPNGKPLVAKRQRYLAGYPYCKWMWSHHDDDRITHWMPPPEEPKTE